MTPKEQRIAIAQVCGWVEKPIGELWQKGEQYAICTDSPNHFQLPYYLTDLNAMHEAESTLPRAKIGDWIQALHDATKAEAALDYVCGDFWTLCRATAAQRAEAFLRTINLWKDDQP